MEHRTSAPSRVWNRIPEDIRDGIKTMALVKAGLSLPELTVKCTDTKSYILSEASVYHLLKAHDLISSPVSIVIKVNDEFEHKTTRLNEVWHNDFAHLKLIGWGWFYLSTILDDYCQYIIAGTLCTTTKVEDVTATLDLALAALGWASVKSEHRQRLLSDNDQSYIADDLSEWLENYKIDQIHVSPDHPQTQGKINAGTRR